MLVGTRFWVRGVLLGLVALALLGPTRPGEAGPGCTLVGVRIRNQTCATLSSGVLVAFRSGVQQNPVWCLGSVCARSSETRTGPVQAADRVFLHFCTGPSRGLQAVIPSQGPDGSFRQIKSVFVQADCCPTGNFAEAYFHDRGPPVRVPLRDAIGKCWGASLCAAPAGRGDIKRVRPDLPDRLSADGQGDDEDENGSLGFPLEVFRAKNLHPTRRIVRVRARPFNTNSALSTLTHTQIPPVGGQNEEVATSSEDADKVIVSVCLDDDEPVRAWIGERGDDLWIKEVNVTLRQDGVIELSGITHGNQDVSFASMGTPDAIDACPRLESFRVVNMHPDYAVVKARAIPSADGYTAPALFVVDVAATNGDKTKTATTQDEATTVTVQICLAGMGTSIMRTLTTNDMNDRIKTLKATVTKVNNQPRLELSATLLSGNNGQVTVTAQAPGPSCPLP